MIDPGVSGDKGSPLVPDALVNGLYRLVRRLGAGGMGEVWEARHERTKGRVALKLLLPEMGRSEESLLRFQREVEITSGINHPNIVRVSDADKMPDGRPFLVMEFLEGADLATLSRAGSPMTLGQVVEIVDQIALGLQAAHDRSIVHRDLKPANVFVVPLPGTTRVLVKILDFGISKALDALNALTRTFTVMGTPHYMAPEQAKAGLSLLDARADQFSLAAIAYELVTGRLAFDGDGMVNVVYKVVNEPPPSFASLGVVAPPGVEAVVLRGLGKSPDDRFATVRAFGDALRGAVEGGGGIGVFDRLGTTAPAVARTEAFETPPSTKPAPATPAPQAQPTPQPATMVLPTPAPPISAKGSEPPTTASTPAQSGRPRTALRVGIGVGVALAVGGAMLLAVGRDPVKPAPESGPPPRPAPTVAAPAAPAAPPPPAAPPAAPVAATAEPRTAPATAAPAPATKEAKPRPSPPGHRSSAHGTKPGARKSTSSPEPLNDDL